MSDRPGSLLPLDIRAIGWDARLDVDAHVQSLRTSSGLPHVPTVSDEQRAAVDRGEGFMVGGRFTTLFVRLRPKATTVQTCFQCDGSGVFDDETCHVCDGEECTQVGYVNPIEADVLAFAPGQGDGRWWAEFRVASSPRRSFGFAVTGEKIAEVIERACREHDVEVAP